MKKRIVFIFLCVLLGLSFVPPAALAASNGAATDGVALAAAARRDDAQLLAPAVSSNRNKHDYSTNTTATTVKSYLYWDGAAFVRVEALTASSQVVVERYSRDFYLLSARTIPYDNTAIWGGFFHGETHNFILLGWANPNEDNQQEVVRVLKYDGNWNLLGYASLCGANTTLPFRAGSLRCAEYGGMLYVHTCHQMYKHTDGRNHQANMTFCVRESDMTVTDAQYQVSSTYGYSSHSFNQYLLIDSEHRIVALDHGDAYPRSAVLNRYKNLAGNDTFGTTGWQGATEKVNLQSFPGAIGDNTTGASLGGLAETANCYITAFNYNGVGADSSGSVMGVVTPDLNQVRNIYVTATNQDSFSDAGTTVKQITAYQAVESDKLEGALTAGTPVLAPTGLDGGYVVWAEDAFRHRGIMYYPDGTTRPWYENTPTDKIQYVRYAADGSVGQIQTASGALSDCQPISVNGTAYWYVTENSAPTFYALNEAGLRAYPAAAIQFTDVPQGAYYFSAVQWALEKDVTAGTSSTTFSPDETCTRAQAVTFLWRAAGKPEPSGSGDAFADVPAGEYYAKAVRWAVEQKITEGTGGGRFSPNETCSRAQIVTFLYRAAGSSPVSDGETFTDVLPTHYFYTAVRWAVAVGVTQGTGNGAFSPNQDCSRAQIVTFLHRYHTGAK